MNRKHLLIIVLLVGVAALAALWLSFRRSIVPIRTHSFASVMKLESPAFAEGQAIPPAFACGGNGTHPELRISGVPVGAKSLALIMHDPDTPSDFAHWIFWNADPATSDVPESAAPSGAVQGRAGNGIQGYIGPCPPSGTHRYVFELFALDAALSIPATTDAAGLRAAMEGHVLDTTTLTGTYTRH